MKTNKQTEQTTNEVDTLPNPDSVEGAAGVGAQIDAIAKEKQTREAKAFNALDTAREAGYVHFNNGEAQLYLAVVNDAGDMLRMMPVNVADLVGLTAHQAGRLTEKVDPQAEARKTLKKLVESGLTAGQIKSLLD